MAQNVEIKARASSFAEQEKIAAKLADKEPELIIQNDTFYKVIEGRLKLRRFAGGSAELIYYRRDNSAGPSMSEYTISKTNDAENLHQILSNAYGVETQVDKQRTLYLSGRTRLHFDRVVSLGDFIELEVVLDKGESVTQGQQEAYAMMAKLNIVSDDLIDVAYADLIQQANESANDNRA